MAKQTLEEALNTTLSPEKVKDMSTDELIKILVDNQIVENEATVRMLIVESVQKAFANFYDFPIRYYSKQEDLVEQAPMTALTDEYIKNQM